MPLNNHSPFPSFPPSNLPYVKEWNFVSGVVRHLYCECVCTRTSLSTGVVTLKKLHFGFIESVARTQEQVRRHSLILGAGTIRGQHSDGGRTDTPRAFSFCHCHCCGVHLVPHCRCGGPRTRSGYHSGPDTCTLWQEQRTCVR